MRFLLGLPITVLLACALIGLTARGAEQPDAAYQRLATRLAQTQTPTGKAKILAQMADKDLDRAMQQMTAGQIDDSEQSLAAYAAEVNQAYELLRGLHQSEKIKPKKYFNAYRDFESALHKHERRLTDLEHLFPFDRKDKIKQAIAANEVAKEEMLVFLFGEENVKSKQDMMGKDR